MSGKDGQLLTFDIGTSGAKCCVFTGDCQVLAAVTEHYPVKFPRAGWAEQEPEDFWKAVVRGTRRLLKEGKLDPRRLEGIGICGQMNGCLPVDAGGEVIRPALIHADSRSAAQRENILQVFSPEEFYRITGNRPDVHLSLPKILWLQENEPEVYRRTAFFLQSKDFIGFRLTGEPGISDFSDASLTAMLDISRREWSSDLLRELKLDPGKLPVLRPSSELRGQLSAAAAELLGLRQGTPVIVGAGDAAAATRGAGMKDSSTVYAYIGSSAWMSCLTTGPALDPGRRMQSIYDMDGRKVNMCGTVQSAGLAIDWIGRLLYGEEGELLERETPAALYLLIEEEIRRSRAGANRLLFLPYLMGERTPWWDEKGRGVFFGLSPLHQRSDLLRAVFEGVGFALRDVLEVYRENGMTFPAVTLLGGGIRSGYMQRILASILGVPVRPHVDPSGATSLGAALAVAAATGRCTSLDLWDSSRLYEQEIDPDPALAEHYEALYRIYHELYPSLRQLFHRFAVPGSGV